MWWSHYLCSLLGKWQLINFLRKFQAYFLLLSSATWIPWLSSAALPGFQRGRKPKSLKSGGQKKPKFPTTRFWPPTPLVFKFYCSFINKYFPKIRILTLWRHFLVLLLKRSWLFLDALNPVISVANEDKKCGRNFFAFLMLRNRSQYIKIQLLLQNL